MKDNMKKKADATVMAALLEFSSRDWLASHENLTKSMGEMMETYHFKSGDPRIDLEFSMMVEEARESFYGLDSPPDNVRLLFLSRYNVSI